jgi:very-short-patch-repair endonuclease
VARVASDNELWSEYGPKTQSRGGGAAAGGRPPVGDGPIAALAARQHGVVATWQLGAIGYTASAVKRRVHAGRLHRVFRGVYVFGADLVTVNGRWMAATLALGPEAVLSHRSAIALWELRPAPTSPIDVTVLAVARRSRRGIRVHNVASLDPRDRAVLRGIPVTSVPRTLLDYAAIAGRQQLRLAIEAADRREVFDGRGVEALLARTAGQPGVRRLRKGLAELTGPAPWTRSELERRFLALIRAAGLPEPHANSIVAGFEVDLHWPWHGLVVELDGYAFHKSRAQFEQDRRRDAALQVAGHPVLRITQRRIEDEPRRLIREVVAMLERARAISDGSGPAASGP